LERDANVQLAIVAAARPAMNGLRGPPPVHRERSDGAVLRVVGRDELFIETVPGGGDRLAEAERGN